jgi:predicted kinase
MAACCSNRASNAANRYGGTTSGSHGTSLTVTTWVLFAGLPGTGKSTLAWALAARMHAAILDKDRVRAALFPGNLTDYTAQQDDLCMGAMLAAAGYLPAQRATHYIFFDGRTFSLKSQIEQVVLAAESAGAAWRILHLRAEDAVAEARLTQGEPSHPAKNRGPELYRALRERFEPILRAALVVDTTTGFANQLEAICDYLAASPGPVR